MNFLHLCDFSGMHYQQLPLPFCCIHKAKSLCFLLHRNLASNMYFCGSHRLVRSLDVGGKEWQYKVRSLNPSDTTNITNTNTLTCILASQYCLVWYVSDNPFYLTVIPLYRQHRQPIWVMMKLRLLQRGHKTEERKLWKLRLERVLQLCQWRKSGCLVT